jgi:NAD(P)-dependent dehydrogenase (short-subunit alcohol dehydrogenase family)
MSKADGRKSIFITGAASGIGLAAARHFAGKGWYVGLSDVNVSGLDAAHRAIGDQDAMCHALDVRDREDWTKALGRFAEHTDGRLDVLLNNAGIARYGWFEEVAPEEADLQIDINLKGVVNGAYAGLDLLRATPGSRLVNVASCAGLYGSPRLAVYSATKFAVRGFSEALDVEFARYGVSVRCVMPWFVETPILESGSARGNQSIRDSIKAGGHPVYTVDEAAQVIWEAAHGEDVHYVVGKMGKNLRFASRFFPGRLRKQMKSAALA